MLGEPPTPLQTWLSAESGDIAKATGKPETQREAGAPPWRISLCTKHAGKATSWRGRCRPPKAPHQRECEVTMQIMMLRDRD